NDRLCAKRRVEKSRTYRPRTRALYFCGPHWHADPTRAAGSPARVHGTFQIRIRYRPCCGSPLPVLPAAPIPGRLGQRLRKKAGASPARNGCNLSDRLRVCQSWRPRNGCMGIHRNGGRRSAAIFRAARSRRALRRSPVRHSIVALNPSTRRLRMPSTYNVMIMGASYGSLLATKLLFGGHKVKLVRLPAEAEVINQEGSRVRLPIKGRSDLVEIDSRKLPGKLSAD